jgi:hypothetical protein
MISQISTFTTFNVTNTTSSTQSLVTPTEPYSGNGKHHLPTDNTTLVSATATPPAPSQPTATPSKKSAGSRSAQNPVAQLVKYFRTLVPGSNPKSVQLVVIRSLAGRFGLESFVSITIFNLPDIWQAASYKFVVHYTTIASPHIV